jgi:hypothetical protein
MTLTFTYANSNTPIAGVKVVMTESDGTVIVLVTNSSGQITLPSTSNTYTLSASLAEAGEDPISLIDAIQILQYAGELRTLTDDQKTAADVNNDGEVDVLDAIWILQHQGELRTLDSSLIFLDANTGQPLSQTTFSSNDTPSITVVRKGDVDGDFDPSLITDHAPIITGKTTLVMDENETSVSTLVGSDADGDALTYSIIGGADQSLFSINSATGVLTFKASPDYEDPTDSNANNLYDIEVSVSDGTNTNAQALVISIKDLNEKMAMTNKLINENTPGATVGDLSILYTDFGNENITYVLSGTDAQYFVLEGTTIKLKSDVTTDYETKNSYTLTITATNASGTSLVEEVILKVNSTPTNILISNDSIVENEYGTVISSLTVIDLNNNESFSYGLSGEHAAYFKITDAGVLKLKDYVFADYEHINTLNVTVKATDQGGLSIEKSFQVNVTNVDYATPYAPDLWSWPWIVASEDSEINALLMEKWGKTNLYISFDPDNNPNTPLTITYSVVTTQSVISPYYQDEVSNSIVNGSSEWEAMVDQAFVYWGVVSGINFVKVLETDSKVGDIRIGLSSGDFGDSGGWSWADSGTYSIDGVDPWGAEMSQSQDIWVRAEYDPITGSSYGPYILIHEIGHSLGLSHTFSDKFNSSKETNITLYSVMAYAGDSYLLNSWDIDGDGINEWDQGDFLFAIMPSINDIKAIQYIYGMTPEFNNGDTEYAYKGPVYETIYDTGGTDTLDLSFYNLNIELDLRGGHVSYIGSEEISISKPTEVGSSDSYYENSGFPISIASETVIENAITGDGNDSIICNIAINTITSNLGDDFVLGISTGDTIYGGGGDDIFNWFLNDFNLIDGGEGIDLLYYVRDSLDLTNFINGSFASIEKLSIKDQNPTLVSLNLESILNFDSSSLKDIDEDGDTDYYFLIFGDSEIDTILVTPQEWTFYKVVTMPDGFDYDVFNSDGGDTYFASRVGMGVYDGFSEDASSSIDKQTVEENLANASVGLLSPTDINQLSSSSSLSFILSGDDAEFFEIYNYSQLRIKPGTIVDYETQIAFNVTVTLGYYVGSEFTRIGPAKNYEITVINGVENEILGQHWSLASSESITGTSDDDFIDYDGGDDKINGKNGNDILLFDHNYTSAFEILTIAGITAIRVGSSAGVDYRYDDLRLINVESIKFDDTYLSLDTELPAESIIWGTTDGEGITGTNGDDLLDSAGGNDGINGGAGTDILVIFSYKDYFDIQTVAGITKFYGSTSVSYNTYSTSYFYSGHTTKMINVESIRFIDESLTLDTTLAGESIIWGSSASENLIGTNEDDLFDSAGGDDYIDGKAGNDTLAIFTQKEDFTFFGETATLGGITKMLSGWYYWSGSIGSQYNYNTIKLINVETVQFNDESLTLDTTLAGEVKWGTSASENLIGTDENDLFDSAGGDDYIDGKAGNDTLTIFSYKGFFEIFTVAGITKLFTNSATDLGTDYNSNVIRLINTESIIFIDETIDISTELASENIIWGTTASEKLTGTDEDNLFDSYGSDDTINGKAGNNTLAIFSSRDNFEILTITGITKILGNKSTDFLISNDYNGDLITMMKIGNVVFSDQSITLDTTLPEGNETIHWGTSGSENLIGNSQNEMFDSGGGSDYINGNGGNDLLIIFSDYANFEIQTVAGITKIYGSIEANGLASAYYTGNGYNMIRSVNVENVAFTDQTIALDTTLLVGNYIWGKFWWQGSETITGTSGNDIIDSNGGMDTIDGGEGEDTLLIFANKEEFDIVVNANGTVELTGTTLTMGNAYYTDTIVLSNVETIIFTDQTVVVAELLSSSASNSVAGIREQGLIIDDTNDNDITATDDSIKDIPSGMNLWTNEFDLNSITLPETVLDTANETTDPTDLNGFLGFESDSLALNFDAFSEDFLVADAQPVKTVDLSNSHAVMDHYQDSLLDDLVYSSELG